MTARQRLIEKLEDRMARYDRDAAAANAKGEIIAGTLYTGWRDATAEAIYDVRSALDDIEMTARVGTPDPEDVLCNCGAGSHEQAAHDPYCPRNPLYEWSPGELAEAFGR